MLGQGIICDVDPYKGKTIYGPYTRKDGRQHIVVYDRALKTRTTVSYPKYLVEVHLGRLLHSDDETIDHIDGDFSNNDFGNLRIKDRSTHSSEDCVRIVIVGNHTCLQCGGPISRERLEGSLHNRRRPGGEEIAGPFCSRSCTGKYGAQVRKTGKRLAQFQIDSISFKTKSVEVAKEEAIGGVAKRQTQKI